MIEVPDERRSPLLSLIITSTTEMLLQFMGRKYCHNRQKRYFLLFPELLEYSHLPQVTLELYPTKYDRCSTDPI